MSNQIPHEFEADTMQVPRGQFSVLSELQNRRTYKCRGNNLSLLELRKYVEFRSNVAPVGKVLIGEIESRHVAKLCT